MRQASVLARALRAVAAAALACVLLLGPPPTRASACAALRGAVAQHRAGLVVSFSDGSVKQFCVSFAEDEISGIELLRRSGLPLVYQEHGGNAVAVCRIGGEGCAYPGTPCFCRCRNAAEGCSFWGYYSIDPPSGTWRFASVGAGIRRVRDGDVDGWRWGSHMPEANPPPAASLASVCAAGTAISSAPRSDRTTRAPGFPTLVVVIVGAIALGAWGIRRLRAARSEGT